MKTLEVYGHGGDLRTASELFGHKPEDFLDYSANMNPYGPPTAVRHVILSYADQIHAYPDPAVRELTGILARKHGIGEEHILVGNGAAELIDLAVRHLKPRATGLAFPCFGEYADAVHKVGSAIEPLMLPDAEGFALSAAQVEQSGLRPELWLLGTPNNPTGQLLDRDTVQSLLNQGGDVILDEAFMDFVADEAEYSWASEAACSDRLLVIRSLTKFYTIPGIRAGYMIGSAARIQELSKLQVPWSVNSLAERIGCAVLQDEAYVQRTLSWLPPERSWLAERLAELGLCVYESAANYILLRLDSAWELTVDLLQAELGKEGILIRNASRYEGLSEGYLRIAVKLRPDNERLLKTLGIVLEKLRARRDD
ncbi:threonine-phosphate decarboxylase CobD [Paenibacillus daejeonensis]|uniref:threonine-phosphate decarboxylase CobD n=1 Tax=Paenibacillus daejeonensis TaxID=135193 RepID=UPI000362A5AB|nr:threonine-phosphate decarboxylase CobD [Paenibacillus daejeonensis]